MVSQAWSRGDPHTHGPSFPAVPTRDGDRPPVRRSAVCAPLAGPGEGQRASVPLTPPGPRPCCENHKCAPWEAESWAEGQAWWGLRGSPGAPTLRLKPEGTAALRPQAPASPRAEMFLRQVRRDDRPNGAWAGQAGTHAVCCLRSASASTCSSPHPPPRGQRSPYGPRVPALAGIADLPVEVLPELQAGSGRVPLQRDRQAATSPCGAPEQELVAYFPGSPPSPSKLPSGPSLSAPPRLQGCNVPGSPGGDPESWVLEEGSCTLAVGASHLSPLW